MQDILGYSPLEAGVRFLPSTLMIVADRADRRPARRPLRPALADRRRAGPARPPRCCSFTGIAVDSTYGDLLPGFILLGIGIALTMSPMSSAAMNAVRGPEGRRRLRRPLDVPHGRRQPRRRRHRRDLPGRGRHGQLRRRPTPAATSSTRSATAMGVSGGGRRVGGAGRRCCVIRSRAAGPPRSPTEVAEARRRARGGELLAGRDAERAQPDRAPASRSGSARSSVGSVSTLTAPSAAIVSRFERLDRRSGRRARA